MPKRSNSNIFFQTVSNHKFSDLTDTGTAVLSILEKLLQDDELTFETELTFEKLFEYVPAAFPQDDFIHAVFFLTRRQPNYNVLRQRFKALNPETEIMQEIDVQLVLPYLQSNKFENPISKLPVTREQFASQVITFFSPTKDFLESKKTP